MSGATSDDDVVIIKDIVKVEFCHHYTVLRSTCIYIQATKLQTCIFDGYILS